MPIGLEANTLHHVSFLFFTPLPASTRTHIERHIYIHTYTQTQHFCPISELTLSIQQKTDRNGVMAYLYGMDSSSCIKTERCRKHRLSDLLVILFVIYTTKLCFSLKLDLFKANQLFINCFGSEEVANRNLSKKW